MIQLKKEIVGTSAAIRGVHVRRGNIVSAVTRDIQPNTSRREASPSGHSLITRPLHRSKSSGRRSNEMYRVRGRRAREEEILKREPKTRY